MSNPYQQDLGTRDALTSLGDTPEKIRAIVGKMRDEDFARSYGPSKWSVTQLLDHLAQAEMIFGMRLRMALTSENYVVQPYDQDRMMAREGRHTGREAFDAYYTLRRWNLALFRDLTAEDRERRFMHPERGEMRIAELLETMAGHELHHLPQIEAVANR